MDDAVLFRFGTGGAEPGTGGGGGGPAAHNIFMITILTPFYVNASSPFLDEPLEGNSVDPNKASRNMFSSYEIIQEWVTC